MLYVEVKVAIASVIQNRFLKSATPLKRSDLVKAKNRLKNTRFQMIFSNYKRDDLCIHFTF
jgi:hypothetical protein